MPNVGAEMIGRNTDPGHHDLAAHGCVLHELIDHARETNRFEHDRRLHPVGCGPPRVEDRADRRIDHLMSAEQLCHPPSRRREVGRDDRLDSRGREGGDDGQADRPGPNDQRSTAGVYR